MSERKGNQLPIGYWLKRADELLTQRIDEAQRSNGLTRLEWQALNVIRGRAGVRREEIAHVLRPFAGAAEVDEAIGRLAARGAVGGPPEDGFELTPAGAELYEKALAVQQSVRQRAVAGISEAEYATTMAVLQRLVANLSEDAT
ncbi:MAG TPA: MarR family winged helix-turn-helix transcriptional regulator [Longimicrobiales bacterium]